MRAEAASNQREAVAAQLLTADVAILRVEQLTGEHAREVSDFLVGRALHTIFLAGPLRDNGIVSRLNRGAFYGCRNARGVLEGVALIGHAIMFDARTEAALRAIAHLAQQFPAAHLILGQQHKIERFWHYYAEAGQEPRLAAREFLLELTWPFASREAAQNLRPARMEDLPLVVPVHARMAFEESGVNPLQTNPEAFRLRCARRIEQGRVWVLTEGDRLIFKADIIYDTPDVIYLEGIYVSPEARLRGYARRCLSELSRNLLSRTRSLTLLVNEHNQAALRFYSRSGFRLRGIYHTIFLRNDEC